MQDIGQSQLQIGKLSLQLLQLLIDDFQLRTEELARGEQFGAVLASGLRESDRLGIGVALRAQAVGFNLNGLASLLDGGKRADVENEAAAPKLRSHSGQIAT